MVNESVEDGLVVSAGGLEVRILDIFQEVADIDLKRDDVITNLQIIKGQEIVVKVSQVTAHIRLGSTSGGVEVQFAKNGLNE